MTTTAIIPELTKRIAYNKAGDNYDCYIAFDGGDEQYIGSAATYGEAEKKCQDFTFDYYSDAHTPEKAAQVALNGIPTAEPLAAASPVTVKRHWTDENEHPDAPPAGSSAWTDYASGCVLFGVNEVGSGIDLNICGVEHPTTPVTLATLTHIYTSLGHLLSDPRVQAVLPADGLELSERPLAQMVRVKFTANCSFPLALTMRILLALDDQHDKLHITRDQINDLRLVIAQVIEEMFDLSRAEV